METLSKSASLSKLIFIISLFAVHLGDEYRRMCRNDRRIRLAGRREGFISSLSARGNGGGRRGGAGPGTAGCPWLIEAPPGQRINLTLLDFGPQIDLGRGSGGPVPAPYCQR